MTQSAATLATILLVEDSDDSRQMLRLTLESWGYRVMEAHDGREATEAARERCPDLILMDLNMPVLDGIAATRLLHQLPETAAVPVVAVTAHCGDSEWRDRALEAGCIECVGKPLDFGQLEQLIDRMHCGF